MGLGRQGDQQGTMYLAWDGIPRSRGHAFYDHLLQILRGSGFDAFAEKRHCAASFSLRDFLQLSTKESVPGHSSLSRTQFRLPLTTHQEVFTWILKVRNKDGLVFGGRIGVDASGMEANAALQPIARRDTGESYHKMLLRMAKESGRASPTDENLARMDASASARPFRTRTGSHRLIPRRGSSR